MTIDFCFTAQAAFEYEQVIEYLSIVLGGSQAAKNFEDEFLRVVSIACSQPDAFPLAKNTTLANRGYRVLLIKNYLALYEHGSEKLIIVHIFHQSQDYSHLVC